jgi:hypothetical protein
MIRAPKTATAQSANVGSAFISHPPLAVHWSFHWAARSSKGKIRRFISYLSPGVGLKKMPGMATLAASYRLFGRVVDRRLEPGERPGKLATGQAETSCLAESSLKL